MAADDTGGMIALVPEDPDGLTVPGGEPAEELHLTLAYLGSDIAALSDASRAALHETARRLASNIAPVEGRIMGHALWNPDGGPNGDMDACSVYQVQPHPAIQDARDYAHGASREVLGADFPEQHPGFLPHITGGYGITPDKLSYAGPVKFNAIRLALGPETTDYPLSGYSEGAMDMGFAAAVKDKPTIEARPEVDLPAPDLNEDNGLAVTFPVVMVEGLETSDGRFIEPGSLSHRALPLPILAQTRNPEGGDGHAGADVIGRLDTLTRVPGPEVIDKETGEPFPEGVFVWSGTGFIDPEAPATRLAQKGYLTGNSADLSGVEATFVWAEGDDVDAMLAGPEQIRITAGQIAATTLVPIPAFAQAYMTIDGAEALPNAETITASASPMFRSAELGDDCLLCMAGIDTETHDGPTVRGEEFLTASATVTALRQPLAWFVDPELDGPTPLTVTEDGRVFGHLATWGTCHIGFPGQCVTPPHSPSDYAYFRTGAVSVQDGDATRQVSVGRITLGTGHADTKLAAMEAAAHYDNTGFIAARVAAGDDAYGIWVAGAVKPGVTAEQIADLAASPLSGDWRSINGQLELVAALAVNVAGFPPAPRARVASGAPVALVAAGVVQRPEPPTNAAALDYDVLADAIADRLEARAAGERFGARRAALEAELGIDNASVAAAHRADLLGGHVAALRTSLE